MLSGFAAAPIVPAAAPRQQSFDELGTPLAQVTFVVVDLETTGASPRTEAITEMCTIDTDVVVRPRVVEGQAGPVLAEAAEGADLLVVGNRGHGGLAEALLGSVGQYCVRHAPCPVVIMRGKPAADA